MIGDFGTIEGSQQRDIKYVMFNIDELPESDSLQFGFPAQTAPKACVRVTCRFQKQRGHLNQEGDCTNRHQECDFNWPSMCQSIGEFETIMRWLPNQLLNVSAGSRIGI